MTRYPQSRNHWGRPSDWDLHIFSITAKSKMDEKYNLFFFVWLNMLCWNGLGNYFSNRVIENPIFSHFIQPSHLFFPLIALTTQITPIHSSPLALSVSALEISALQFWLRIPPFANNRFPLYSIVKKKKLDHGSSRFALCRGVPSGGPTRVYSFIKLPCEPTLRKKGGKKITKPVIL